MDNGTREWWEQERQIEGLLRELARKSGDPVRFMDQVLCAAESLADEFAGTARELRDLGMQIGPPWGDVDDAGIPDGWDPFEHGD